MKIIVESPDEHMAHWLEEVSFLLRQGYTNGKSGKQTWRIA